VSKRPTTAKIQVADSPEELDEKIVDATSRPAPQVDIADYAAGGKLKLEDDRLVENPTPLIAADGGGDAQALDELNAGRKQLFDKQRATGPLLPAASTTRYESRIRIAEAWQYNGSLADAPSFVDRSWAAWGDYDDDRNITPGPALRVPIPSGKDTEKMCRKGDYVVKQEVTLALGMPPDITVDVWKKEDFEKFFLPRRIRNLGDPPTGDIDGPAPDPDTPMGTLE
jgi:hypothetical protein